MLIRLSVSNLAIVEKAEVEFGAGLNVITGETGAGKSVLMGALELVLGGRADAGLVRDGAKEAEVEAVFSDCTIRRTVTAEGRSRAWVDDESVSIAELRELGLRLVDHHGPRANQLLLEERFQRETLDALGGVDSSGYARAFAAFSGVKARLASLGDELSEDELDFLRFQVNELEAADLTEDDETIGERHAAAAHSEDIVENANAITEALGGDRSAAETLIALHPKFAAIAKHLPAAADWGARCESITLDIQELSRTIADEVSGLGASEEDFEALDARLTLVNRLKRKYLKSGAGEGGGISRLLSLLGEKKAKLEANENRGEMLAALTKELAAAECALREAGAALTSCRRSAGQKLAKAITRELHDLGFLQARFSVALEPAEPEPHGMDRVVYLFEPNPGEAARPLAAIASSGEIARVMLAVKTVTSSTVRRHAVGATPTIVFDEIDANIGGEVGRTVGEKLLAVSKGRQVIAITHLPQSAVYGERHLVVAKSVVGGRTRTSVSAVEGEGRVREIARMLGGEELTSVVKRHAEELLEISG